LDLWRVERELLALAAAAGGHLQVADEGEMAYVFPRNLLAICLGRVWRLRLRQGWRRAWAIVFTLIRFSFGTVLMGLIIAAMLLLVGIAYSSADLLLPCLRDLWLLRRNNRLQMRNAWRRERARALQQGSPRVERKVARASRQARERRLEATDLACSTEQDLMTQEVENPDKVDAEWRRRLNFSQS
jgi:hypothetical protein